MVFIVNIQLKLMLLVQSIDDFLSLKPRKGCIYLERNFQFKDDWEPVVPLVKEL